MALSAARNTLRKLENETAQYPVAAATTIYKGSMVGLLAGYLVPMSTAVGLKVIGRSEQTVVNAGSAGDEVCNVTRGVFAWLNPSTTITQAMVGQVCYAVDDQSVSATDTLGTKSPAGVIIAVDSTDGVWVDSTGLGAGLLDDVVYPKSIITLPVELAALADGEVVANITPGFVGRILRVDFLVAKPATTAAKLSTLTPRIGTTALTGGVLALTSANMTPVGKVVNGTAITALNTFGAADTIDVQASSTTAFVEGSGAILLHLG